MTTDFVDASKPEERREEKEKVEKGSSEKRYFLRGNMNFRLSNFSGRLFVLVKVGWREGTALGYEEGRLMGSRLLHVVVREKTLSRVFTTFDRDFDVNIWRAVMGGNFDVIIGRAALGRIF
jgi:hypothetical protein